MRIDELFAIMVSFARVKLKYHLVFDVVQSGCQGCWFAANGLFPLAIGILIKKGLVRGIRFQAEFMIVFSSLWIIWTFSSSYSDFTRMRNALLAHQYTLVEGTVTQLDPMSDKRHGGESFVVSGHRFSYSDHTSMAGFNHTHSHGGPIREGLQVRIADVEGKIARLEIAE